MAILSATNKVIFLSGKPSLYLFLYVRFFIRFLEDITYKLFKEVFSRKLVFVFHYAVFEECNESNVLRN